MNFAAGKVEKITNVRMQVDHHTRGFEFLAQFPPDEKLLLELSGDAYLVPSGDQAL